MKCQSGYYEAYSYLACAKTFEDRLKNESLISTSFYTPTIILTALSIEVFIKTIYIQEDIDAKIKHSILKGWNNLSDRAKLFILEKMNIDSSTLLKLTKEADLAFEDWRYCYEEGKRFSKRFPTTMMINLAESLCLYLEQAHEYIMTDLVSHKDNYSSKRLMGNNLIRIFNEISIPMKLDDNSFIYKKLSIVD